MKTLVKKLILTTTTILLIAGYTFAQNQVDGHLTYHNSWPMDNSTVLLMDMSGNVLQSAPTDGTGYYQFDNVPNGDFQLTATTQLSAGGIDMGDAFMIMMHLYGMYPFNNIEQMTADVDDDGMVTWNDYFAIVFGWFTQGYPFPAGDWTFETINVSVTGSRDGATGNFGGSSTGDVNHSLIPDKAGNIFDLNIDEYTASYNSNEFISIPITISSHKILGGGFISLSYPDQLIISSVKSNVDSMHFNILENELRISLINNEMNEAIKDFTVEVIAKSKEVNSASNEFGFELAYSSHFVDNSGKIVHGVNVTVPSIKIEDAGVSTEVMELSCKSYPNPFNSHVTLEFNTSFANSYKVLVHNSTGQVVQETSYLSCQEGSNNIKIEMSKELPGMYFYSIVSANNEIIYRGSMIKL